MKQVAEIHKGALPHTLSSRLGVAWLTLMYIIVKTLGYVKVEKRGDNIVGVISGIGRLILTLVVDPTFQHKGIGRRLLQSLPGERWVYTQNNSVGFYEKMGFNKIFTIGKTIFLRRNS